MFLTARSDEIDRVVGLELGADDYVAKPFSPRELVARVRTILRRAQRDRGRRRPRRRRGGPFVVDAERHQIRFYGRALELSRYEYGLLRTLIHAPGARLHARRAAAAGVGRARREPRPHGRCARQDAARQAEGGGAGLEPIRTHRGSGYALAEDLPASPS